MPAIAVLNNLSPKICLLMFEGIAINEIALRVTTILASIANGILDFLPDIGHRQLRIEVIGLLNRIGQNHPRLLFGDERTPPPHLAGQQVLFFNNVAHLSSLLEHLQGQSINEAVSKVKC